MGMMNPLGKTRPSDKPYLTISDGQFTWKVLKAYALDPDKQYARWFLATASPYTGGSDELGDGYIADVTGYVIQRDPGVPDEAIPSHLRNRAAPNWFRYAFGFEGSRT